MACPERAERVEGWTWKYNENEGEFSMINREVKFCYIQIKLLQPDFPRIVYVHMKELVI